MTAKRTAARLRRAARRRGVRRNANRACGECEEHARASPRGKQREQAPALHRRRPYRRGGRRTSRQVSAPGTMYRAPTKATAWIGGLAFSGDIKMVGVMRRGCGARLGGVAFGGRANRACGECEELARASPRGKWREPFDAAQDKQAPALHRRRPFARGGWRRARVARHGVRKASGLKT